MCVFLLGSSFLRQKKKKKGNSQSTHFTPTVSFFLFFIMGIQGIIGQHDLPNIFFNGNQSQKNKEDIDKDS